jgi:hypothetical protein
MKEYNDRFTNYPLHAVHMPSSSDSSHFTHSLEYINLAGTPSLHHQLHYNFHTTTNNHSIKVPTQQKTHKTTPTEQSTI